jgi:hypothetical protein
VVAHHVGPAEPEDGFGPGVPAGYNATADMKKNCRPRTLLPRTTAPPPPERLSIAFVPHRRHNQLRASSGPISARLMSTGNSLPSFSWHKSVGPHPSASREGLQNIRRAWRGGAAEPLVPSSSLAAYPQKA